MQRDLKIDGLKFILIFLVVLGHLSFYDYGIGLRQIIYAFHMPMFVFLSGYFTSMKNDKDKQAKWLKRTFLIFIIAQICHIILNVILRFSLGIIYKTPFDLLCLNDFYHPKFGLWYLLCLIYWRLFAWTLYRKAHDITLLIVSVVLSIVIGFVPLSQFLSFQRAFSFLPFFIFGIIFKRRNWIEKITKTPVFIAVIIIVICCVIARHLPSFEPKYHYDNLNDASLRIIQSIIGFLMCLAIIRISYVSNCIEKFAKYGTYTLWIYIGHTFFIVTERALFPPLNISYNIFLAIPLAVLYCILFILLAKSYKNKTLKKVRQ